MYFNRSNAAQNPSAAQGDEVFQKRNDPLTDLDFDSKIVDFSDVPSDTILNAVFVIKNTGDKPLIIYNVNPDCSCTGYSLSKYNIAVADTASLTLMVDTKNKHGQNVLNTTIKANTDKGLYNLRVKANVIK